MLHKYTTLSQCISADMCGICNESIEKYYLSNVCYDCMKYAEHEVCAQEQLRGDTATLIIDTLNHVLKYDESTREYAINVSDGTVCPKEMSVLTRGFVDLTELFDKPLDDAYFEVTFLAFKSEEKVGIFVDSERESQPLLFGPDATAFMNDGKVRSDCHFDDGSLTIIRFITPPFATPSAHSCQYALVSSLQKFVNEFMTPRR
jgi:hypothetical protein